MSIHDLRLSLRLWRRRLRFRERRLDFYAHHSQRPQPERLRLVKKWARLTDEARAAVHHRQTQISKAQRVKLAGTPRARAVELARRYAGHVTESPPGSNRGGIITAWQSHLASWLVGAPWCGVFCAAILKAVGVHGVNARLAAVSLIEDDARARRRPFKAWTTDPRAAMRGDLVVLFGRGVHVELVDHIDIKRGVVYTIGGNTTAGAGGNQANGGGVYRRARPLSAVHGFAITNYPG